MVRKDPNFSLYLVKIDLSDPRVSAHVSRGGADPDGDGPWLTTLLPASEIAEREHYDIAINGDFFVAEATVDIEGKKTGYIKGKSARPEGMAMTDGQLWHHSAKTAPYLEITSNNIAKLAVGGPDSPIDPAARQIVGGGQIIERNHQAVVYTNKFAIIRNPRTVVGIAKNGTQLVLLVVDGRQPKLSVGMTLSELADEMIHAGCDEAINLDGGGSTTLVYRDPVSHQLQILNSPSDGKERSVADVLGVSVKAPLPEAK
jgi:exopolysaccharide biosynthesis protein